MAELRKQKKKLQQMDDSVDRTVVERREAIDKQIDLLSLALYQKQIETAVSSIREMKEEHEEAVKTKEAAIETMRKAQ